MLEAVIDNLSFNLKTSLKFKLTSTGQLSCLATCFAYVGESLAMAHGARAEPDINTTRLNKPR